MGHPISIKTDASGVRVTHSLAQMELFKFHDELKAHQIENGFEWFLESPTANG